MELRYHIQEPEHQRYIQARRRAKALSPFSLIVTALLTAFPLFVLLYAVVENVLSGWQLGLFALAAVALSGANFYTRARYWRKDDTKLPKSIHRSDDEFWKEHRLIASKDGVVIHCGSLKREYPWAAFGGFEEFEELLIPIFNAQSADLIPIRALDSMGGSAAFQETFTKLAKSSMQALAAQGAENAEPAPVALTFSYSYTADTYIRDQRDATRKRYTTKLFLNRAVMSKFALTVLMIYAIATAKSAGMVLVYAAIALILNYEHISVFTPLLEKRMRKELRSLIALQPDRKATLTLTNKRLRVAGDLHYLDLPFTDIIMMRKLPHALAFYLTSNTVLTVPGPPDTKDGDLDKLFRLLQPVIH